MKITASVDSRLGDRTLERGKTYDVKEQEAKHLLRAGLARKSDKAPETVKAAGGNTTVTDAGTTARKDGKR